MDFHQIWDLLSPQGEFKRRENACRRLWQGYGEALQLAIFEALSKAKAHGESIKPNPYFAIEDAALALQNQAPRQQTMSFDDYYKKFGTTEDTDGWKRKFLPEKQTTIYVKSWPSRDHLPIESSYEGNV